MSILPDRTGALKSAWGDQWFHIPHPNCGQTLSGLSAKHIQCRNSYHHSIAPVWSETSSWLAWIIATFLWQGPFISSCLDAQSLVSTELPESLINCGSCPSSVQNAPLGGVSLSGLRDPTQRGPTSSAFTPVPLLSLTSLCLRTSHCCWDDQASPCPQASHMLLLFSIFLCWARLGHIHSFLRSLEECHLLSKLIHFNM